MRRINHQGCDHLLEKVSWFWSLANQEASLIHASPRLAAPGTALKSQAWAQAGSPVPARGFIYGRAGGRGSSKLAPPPPVYFCNPSLQTQQFPLPLQLSAHQAKPVTSTHSSRELCLSVQLVYPSRFDLSLPPTPYLQAGLHLSSLRLCFH